MLVDPQAAHLREAGWDGVEVKGERTTGVWGLGAVHSCGTRLPKHVGEPRERAQNVRTCEPREGGKAWKGG